MRRLFRKEVHRLRRMRVRLNRCQLPWSMFIIFLSAVTFGAGVQWGEAYDYVDEQGRFIIGGLSQGGSVGSAGGWVMGGGHSAFSPSLGLGTYD